MSDADGSADPVKIPVLGFEEQRVVGRPWFIGWRFTLT
jgi:hypothetical protein